MREHKSISIADQVFEQLERDILSGRYERGTLLSELGLAEELGVSRTPVREAVRRLEQEHILEESGKGLKVIGISHEDVLDMYDIRLAIEGTAARRAAARISEEELSAMREVLDLQHFYLERSGEQNSDQIKNLDSRFHELLYESAGKGPYQDTLLSLHKKISKFRRASFSLKSRAEQSVKEHEKIYAALEGHDEDAAEAAVRAHTKAARKRIQKLEE